jgi:hypothetical protein
MDKGKLENLQEILCDMFPELKPGEILFELGIEPNQVNWEMVLNTAIEYAEMYKPEFKEQLENL